MKTKTTKKKVTKKVKKIIAVKKPVNTPQYTANAIVMGKKYQSKGKTVSEAIGGLEIKNCKGKLILSVTDGTTTRERVMMPNIAFRLFSASRMMRDIALKSVSQLFF